MQRRSWTMQVVDTWTSALARSWSPASRGSSADGRSRIATRAPWPARRLIGTRLISSDLLPLVAATGWRALPSNGAGI
jgi:hypothetical protein